MPDSFTAEVGRKFNEDGTVRKFPGNTIICPVDPNSQTFQQSHWIQEQLKVQPFAHKLTILPSSSFHMTVIQLLCDQVRKPEEWSNKLPLDATLEATDQFFIETVPGVAPITGVTMKYWKMKTWGTSINIILEPADEVSHQELSHYRNAIAEATGVRFPNHDRYVFHITLAYMIQELTDVEQLQLEALGDAMNKAMCDDFGLFTPGAPMLTFFDNMFAFVPESERLKLASRGSLET